MGEADSQFITALSNANLRSLTIENSRFVDFAIDENDADPEPGNFDWLDGLDIDFENEKEIGSFDLSALCVALSGHSELEALSIRDCDLQSLLQRNTDHQRQFVHLLATHSGLQRVELNQNNLSDGGMFADALLLRSQPLAI